MAKYREGAIVRIAKDNDNDSYPDRWRDTPLRITHVATNRYEHPGYDKSAGGRGLYDLEDANTKEACPFSLYDWEISR